MNRKHITKALGAATLVLGALSQLGFAYGGFGGEVSTRREMSGIRLHFPVNERVLISNKHCDRTFDMRHYEVCFDDDSKLAKIVRYTLEGDKVGAVNIKERPRFYQEMRLPKHLRAHYMDYKGGVVQRGHLAEDASFDYEWKVLESTYCLINIVPMYPAVNEETWSKAERYSRYVAKKLGSAEVINIVRVPKNPQRIGWSKLAIPEGFYKIIYNRDADFKRCFYYQNRPDVDIDKDTLKAHEISCEEVYIPN